MFKWLPRRLAPRAFGPRKRHRQDGILLFLLLCATSNKRNIHLIAQWLAEVGNFHLVMQCARHLIHILRNWNLYYRLT